MSEPFIGEIKLVAINFAPRGWAECNGQLLPIAQNTALFSLMGTIYGGDGRTTFGLPDLRGRAAIHNGQGPGLTNHQQGAKGGAESFTMNVNQMPAHSHTATLHGESKLGGQQDMQNRLLGAHEGFVDPDSSTANRDMSAESITVSNAGAGQAVTHRGPYLAVKYIIALEGLFPSRS